ncbi:MAG: hypothetical protein ACC631_02715 [Halocynthiibacter sp.]
MSDITDLERRINAALERIGGLVESVGSVGEAASEEELAALKQALDSEQTANAQLEERVRAMHQKQEIVQTQIESRVERLRERLAEQENELQRFKQVNADLRSSNQALRLANESGQPDADLINASVLAELEALRATRVADRSELDAVLNELKPYVAEDV